jgi:small subunit ribosomal protein S4e
MTKSHLKRINAPKQWNILRKNNKFITRPNPGPHTMNMAVSLNLALKLIGLGNNLREVKFLLNNHEVLVDWRRKKDSKAQIGFLDTLAIPKQNIYYRVLFDEKGKLYLKKTDEKDSVLKISKIVNKTPLGKKIQLNLLDGRNFLVDNGKNYTAGDSLLFELPEQKIKSVLKLERGNQILLYKGKYAGRVAVIESMEGNDLIFKTKEGKFHTKKNFAIVVGQDKPAIVIN